MKTPEEWLEHLAEQHGVDVGSPVVTDPIRLHNVLHHPGTPKYWNDHTHTIGPMGQNIMVPDEDVAYEDQV